MASASDQFIEKVTKLPLAQKIAIAVAVVGVMTGANWYFAVSPNHEQATKLLRRMRQLEEELIQNQAIANNLNQYRREKARLEKQLARALTELPEDANIDELIQSLHEIGLKSGLTITTIEPRAEKRDQFYAAIPVAMKVVGNYHEIAVFFDSISRLKRIVNVSHIKMGGAKVRNEKVQVEATYQATTFRFLPTEQGGAKK